jgi:hypothetical protein
MWEPRRLTTLWVSTAYYRDSFTFFISTLSSLHCEFVYKYERNADFPQYICNGDCIFVVECTPCHSSQKPFGMLWIMLRKCEQHVTFEWVTAARPVDTTSVVKKPAVVGDTETASTEINSPAWIEFLHSFKRIKCIGIVLDGLVVAPWVFADRARERSAAKGNAHFPNAYFAILLATFVSLFIYFRNKFIVARR